MEDNIRNRAKAFSNLIADGKNKRNWELLCSNDKPLIPFIGAGISSWCYPMWDKLLKNVVEKNFSAECAKIVSKALRCGKNGEKPSIKDDAFEDAEKEKEVFRWMEEIAEYIFDINEEAFRDNKDKFRLQEGSKQNDANVALENLHRYLGGYGVNTRQAAVKSLYEAFDIAKLKNAGRFPEYQNFFPRLFPDLLVTTNYDKALEHCYPSIFSYSYSDLGMTNSCHADRQEKSWLYWAVEEKLRQMQDRLSGISRPEDIALPDIPMLLKIHGSIEQASNIALSRERYKVVYNGEMPKLFGHICQHSSLLFMGCGLREDRILDELKKQKTEAEKRGNDSFRHFTFYPEPETQMEKENLEERFRAYGIYPIYYRENVLPDSLREPPYKGDADYHNVCLGILLENLLRRKMHYHQPLEELWSKQNYAPLEISGGMKDAARIQSIIKGAQYVHVAEATQIWELLKSSAECPLIAITGETGSGKSTFCQNIQALNKNPKDEMQFFYISLENCKTWNEFCIQVYQNLNIVHTEIKGEREWQKVAERIEQRCNGYWRSVLIFDHLDALADETMYPGQWEAVKHMLDYLREHQLRVIFTTRTYPKGISCYTWRIGTLTADEAKKVFFSACISRRYENSSLLEQNTLDSLFSQKSFQPASVYLLGRYADSKNDFATLLEEWESCYARGDTEEHTLARLIWNHLLDEHQWADKSEAEKENIEKNILWIWGILGTYPGIFPKAFFESAWSNATGYKSRDLSQKTLIYMKNAGLCEETIDEKYGYLLAEMCRYAKLFYDKINTRQHLNFATDNRPDGLRSFYGYAMDKYDGDLREHSLEEWTRKRAGTTDSMKASNPNGTDNGSSAENDEMDATNSILKILETLGEAVETSDGRRDHKDLNLVLHYEIKTVISFLFTQLSRAEANKDTEMRKRILNIGYLFAHYYCYEPSHAFLMVQHLLDTAKAFEENFALYKRSNLYKIMGDIHRLLGRKTDATECYRKAEKLCDEQMLQSFTNTNGSVPYQESQRIKLDVLLQNHYDRLTSSGGVKDNETEEKTEELEKLCEQIKDNWSKASFNQRMGEMQYAKESENIHRGSDGSFNIVRKYYNAAAEHYGQVEDMTGLAYILKCMGDLIGVFRASYGNKFCLQEIKNQSTVYYQIIECNSGNAGNEDGISAAAHCYAQAFTTYCSHINWRGFANVLQGMGNLLRYCLLDEKDLDKNKQLSPDEFEEIEKIFEFTENCYRWLGDMQGLADTLDYAGYGYEEKGGDVADCIALGKWMECEEIWKKLGNEKKVKNIGNRIESLRQTVNDSLREERRTEQGGRV